MNNVTIEKTEKGEKIMIDGINWYRYPSANKSSAASRYFMTSVEGKEKIKTLHGEQFLHRYIWRKANGWKKIGKSFEIHHADENTANNDISNLIRLTPKEHGIITAANRPRFDLVCEQCGKTFQSVKSTGQFCSRECDDKFYYEHQELWGTYTCKVKTCSIEFKSAHKPLGGRCPTCGKEYAAKVASKNYKNLWKSGRMDNVTKKVKIGNKIYSSGRAAAKAIGVSAQHISNCAVGRVKNTLNVAFV